MINKIIYLNLATYSQTGGIENFNKTFLKALDNLSVQTTSISVYDKVMVSPFKYVNFVNFNKNKFKASAYTLKNTYKIEILIIAHINLLPIAIIAKLLNPKLKIFLLIYGIEVWKKLSLINRIFLKKIKVLSISNYTTSMYMKYNSLEKDNIFYLPPDTTIQIKSGFSNVYTQGIFNILSVSRLDSNNSYKGIDSVIKILPKVIKDIPNLKYTIIGKGNDRDRLEKLANDLNVMQYIEFKGFVENIEPYYQYCDLFILPSKGEGFGIVYLEAMKYKKPCIACNEGGQTDVVIDNLTGYLCEYNNLECLTTKVIKLFKDNTKRMKFGENGYQHLIDNFTFEIFKKRVKDILNDTK